MPVTVLHLSDIHYGNDFIPWALSQGRWFTRRPSAMVTNGLRSSIKELKPDLVVISGDFVNKARGKWFNAAADYLSELLTTAGVNVQEQVLVVPGNHDVSFLRKKGDMERLAAYQKFVYHLFKDDVVEPRPARFVLRHDRTRTIFLALDTTLKTLSPRAEGEIGNDQLTWAKQKLNQMKDQLGPDYERYVKVALMHHHCVPIPGTSAKKERSMQLLDTDGIMGLLKGHHFDLVLHGHKHVPHMSPVLREDGGLVTVVGAGTTLAAYADQQGGHGNNFNVIELDHAAREQRVSRYQAQEDGSFTRLVGPVSFPIFKVPSQGFITKRLRRISRIASNGDLNNTIERHGLRVTGSNRVKTLPVRVTAETPGSRISNFVLKPSKSAAEAAEMIWMIRREEMYDGVLSFAKERTSLDGEISVIYDYWIEKGTVMSRSEMNRRYSNSPPAFEETTLSMASDVDELQILTTFPPGYEVRMEVVFVRHGVELNSDVYNGKYRLDHDEAKNEWTFIMYNPPTNHGINLRWNLPKDWKDETVDVPPNP